MEVFGPHLSVGFGSGGQLPSRLLIISRSTTTHPPTPTGIVVPKNFRLKTSSRLLHDITRPKTIYRLDRNSCMTTSRVLQCQGYFKQHYLKNPLRQHQDYLRTISKLLHDYFNITLRTPKNSFIAI